MYRTNAYARQLFLREHIFNANIYLVFVQPHCNHKTLGDASFYIEPACCIEKRGVELFALMFSEKVHFVREPKILLVSYDEQSTFFKKRNYWKNFVQCFCHNLFL